MSGMTDFGAIFLLKTGEDSGIKEIPQVFYDKGDAVIFMPGTPEWDEKMGRYRLTDYFSCPDFWQAAKSVEQLHAAVFKDKKEVRIALKRTSEGYGDTLMMTLIPRAFKEAFESTAKIVLFTTEDLAPLLHGNMDIDEMRFDSEKYDEESFDLKLNLNSLEFKTKATKNERKGRYRFSRSASYLKELGLWLVDRKPIYRVTDKEREWAERTVQTARKLSGIENGPLILVQLHASTPAKTYPYMEAVATLLKIKGYQVICVDNVDSHSQYPYSLREVGSLVEQADVVVSSDSLLYHLAGALGKRGVALFGYTEGTIFCQDYEKVVPVQAPCPHGKPPCWWDIECLPGDSSREKEVAGTADCLKNLDPNEVVAEVQRQLTPKSKVLITMLTYNLLNMTKKAIASIRSYYDYDVFVVDNESKDGTPEWLASQGYDFVSKKTSVAAAQNIALKKFLAGDYDLFIFLNNDIVLRSDYIDKLVEAQARTGAWGIVGDVLGTPPWAVDDSIIKDYWDKQVSEIPAGSYSATLLTRECVEKVGLFNEVFTPRYIEDNDYTLRIRLAGGSFWQTSHAQFYHALGAVVNTMEEEKKHRDVRWVWNIRKFETIYGFGPHEAQDQKRLGLEWFTAVHGYSPANSIRESSGERTVLVKRNMGGYGDILFTTIVAKALKEEFGDRVVIDYMVPPNYSDVLLENPRIRRVIHEDPMGGYNHVFDLTDLEFRVELGEMGKYGEVKRSRTQIYLDTLGLKCDHKPEYYPTLDEKRWADQEWGIRGPSPRIAVVSKGSNKLKEWEGMDSLISKLRGLGNVKVLDQMDLSFRHAAALASLADIVVSPDSGISNVSAAMRVPTVTIFSNRNGAVFAQMFTTMFPIQGSCPIQEDRDYCEFFTPCFGEAPHRDKENIDSPKCLKNLPVDDVLKKVTEILEKK